MAARGKCHNYFNSSHNSWQLSCWPLSSLTPLKGVRAGRKTEKKLEFPLWSIVLANPTFSKIPLISVCLICAIQKLFYVKKRKLPWVCLALSVLASHSSLKRKSRFSKSKYREFGCTAEMTPFWDPRNFDHGGVFQWHFLHETQDVGGQCTSI